MSAHARRGSLLALWAEKSSPKGLGTHLAGEVNLNGLNADVLGAGSHGGQAIGQVGSGDGSEGEQRRREGWEGSLFFFFFAVVDFAWVTFF